MRPLILALIAMLASCAGNQGQLRMDELEYPVSMSGYIYDRNMKPVRIGAGLRQVGTVEVSKTLWSIFYSGVSLNNSSSLIRDFNMQVARTKAGQGVVNLQVRHRACFLNDFYVLNALPIWPGCAVLTLEGDIIAAEK